MQVAFGTSGLRGPAVAFDAARVSAYVAAFLDHIGARPGAEVFVGCDLRASSPSIAADVIAAIEAHRQHAHWSGVLPTPAVAFSAMAAKAPAIVVTGSHIPAHRNGIKFYRSDGELLKSEEAPIEDRAVRYLREAAPPTAGRALPQPDPAVAAAYVARYTRGFGDSALSGIRLGIFEHSAAGRDLLAEIFTSLGAELVRFGRSETFVAVDTEALDPETLANCATAIERHGLDAVVSSDGDGDRPLLIGREGVQIHGDALCALAAWALGVRTVVTPLTSTSAIELSGWFDEVIRTRIGSPFVVEAMRAHAGAALAGFEANGGFALGSDLQLANGRLGALPTRDAVLPLVAVLAECRRRGCDVSQLAAQLPSRVVRADRLREVPQKVSAAFLTEIAASAALRRSLAPELEAPTATDLTDGVRLMTADGEIVHFRASGNAPELRVYVEAGDAAGAQHKLETIMARLVQNLPRRRQPAGVAT